MTTGLASFVVSQSKKKEQQGEVNIGVVSDTHVHFRDLEFTYDPNKQNDILFKDRIAFDADPNDKEGRIQRDNDSNSREHLTVILTGKVGPVTYINNCTYQFCVPQSVQDAIDAEYIELYRPDGSAYDVSKDYIASPQPLSYSKKGDAEYDEASFSLTIGFKWGSYFNYRNPSHYYDEDIKGKEVSDSDVVLQRKEFRKTMYYGKDYQDPLPDDVKDLPNLTFSINLVAKTRLS